MPPDLLAHLMVVLQGAQGRHRAVTDPVEVLAAFGGFEIAVMVGVMLVAASKRHLLMIDGMAGLRRADAGRAHRRPGHRLLRVLPQPRPPRAGPGAEPVPRLALLELGLESTDGTGAALAWPLVRSAAALLTDVAEGEDPGPSQPDSFWPCPTVYRRSACARLKARQARDLRRGSTASTCTGAGRWRRCLAGVGAGIGLAGRVTGAACAAAGAIVRGGGARGHAPAWRATAPGVARAIGTPVAGGGSGDRQPPRPARAAAPRSAPRARTFCSTRAPSTAAPTR
jgi:hypothetical protein